MRILLFMFLFIQAGCFPLANGTYLELPLPSNPAEREAENQARSLLGEGLEAMREQKWQLAADRYVDALKIRKRIFGENNPYADEAQLKLVWALLAQGHFDRALPILDKVRRSVLRGQSENPTIRAEIAFDTAMVYRQIGHEVYSEELFNESLAIRKKVFGKDHIDTQSTEFWISGACGSSERPAFDDDKLYVFIKQLTESIDHENNQSEFSKRHRAILFCTWLNAHSVMAQRLIRKGDTKKLHKLLDTGEDSILRWYPNCSPMIDYNEMQGNLYASIGEIDEAELKYHYAIRQINALSGRPNDNFLIFTKFRNRKRWAEIRMVSILKGEAHLRVLKGRLAEAENFLLEAAHLIINGRTSLEIFEHGIEQLFSVLVDLAEVRLSQKRYDQASATWLQALELFEIRFRKLAVEQTESSLLMQMASLRNMARSVYSALYTVPMGAARQQLVKVAIATTLLIQGRVTDELSSQLAPFDPMASPIEKEMWQRLLALRMRYATLAYRPIEYTTDGPNTQDKRTLLSDEETLRQAMKTTGVPTGLVNTPSSHTIMGQVQAHIPFGGVLIQYVLYKPYFPTISDNKQPTDSRYLALVLCQNGNYAAVDLGEAKIIDKLLQKLSAKLTNINETYSGEISHKVYDLIIRPLLAFINQSQSVYIIPDGQLNSIPFSVLSGDQTLFGASSQIFYLSSGRDLLHQPNKLPSTDVVVFANPDLDALPDSMPVASTKAADSPYAQSRVLNLRRTPIGLEFQGLGPLKYAEQEANDIQEIFPRTKSYLLSEASEQRLTSLATAPGILHLATHGAFLGEVSTQLKTASRGYLAREYEPPPANPLLRSMLFLAGARRGRLSDDSVYDGLATALELSSLRLQGTQMVVLSACESGLGEVAPGEGVAGLRRAFMVAGAETVVASLWKVDDAVTRELMRSFYLYLRSGEGRAAAMKRASQDVQQKHPHPYYWASFIVIGEGGPLRGMTN